MGLIRWLKDRRRKKYYNKSFEQGAKEHIMEGLVSIVLAIAIFGTIAVYHLFGYSMSNDARIFYAFLILTGIFHFLSRFFHMREKGNRKKAEKLNRELKD